MSACAKNNDFGLPELRIVRGDPTQEELAAVAALISIRADARAPVPPPERGHGRWSDPAAAQRRQWLAGPGGWRAAVR